LDLTIENWYYDETDRFWIGDKPLFVFLYDEIGLLSLFPLVGLFMALYGWWGMVRAKDSLSPRASAARSLILRGLYMVVCVGVAEILAEVILKGYWGRPRPREVDALGGDMPYCRLWYPCFQISLTMDGVDDMARDDIRSLLHNSSFVAGHPMGPIMAVYVYMGLYDSASVATSLMTVWGVGAYTRHRTVHIVVSVVKYLALAYSLGMGVLMGVTRNVQGGHFPSDVMYSFATAYTVGLVGYHFVFGLKHLPSSRQGERETDAVVSVSGGAVCVRLCLFLLTPILTLASVVWVWQYTLLGPRMAPEVCATFLSVMGVGGTVLAWRGMGERGRQVVTRKDSATVV
ncbi:hypothetical protein KIPB_011470, partial [Kipferlia bialata]